MQVLLPPTHASAEFGKIMSSSASGLSDASQQPSAVASFGVGVNAAAAALASSSGSGGGQATGSDSGSPPPAFAEQTGGAGKTYTYRDFSSVPPNPDDALLSHLVNNTQNKSIQTQRFPVKLYAILARKEFSDIITWMPHGRSWKVLQPDLFESVVMPQFFEYSNYHSFNRLINAWSFRRISKGVDRGSYYHELFLRGLPHLQKHMRRLPKTHRKLPMKKQDEPDFYTMAKTTPLPELENDPGLALPLQQAQAQQQGMLNGAASAMMRPGMGMMGACGPDPSQGNLNQLQGAASGPGHANPELSNLFSLAGMGGMGMGAAMPGQQLLAQHQANFLQSGGGAQSLMGMGGAGAQMGGGLYGLPNGLNPGMAGLGGGGGGPNGLNAGAMAGLTNGLVNQNAAGSNNHDSGLQSPGVPDKASGNGKDEDSSNSRSTPGMEHSSGSSNSSSQGVNNNNGNINSLMAQQRAMMMGGGGGMGSLLNGMGAGGNMGAAMGFPLNGGNLMGMGMGMGGAMGSGALSQQQSTVGGVSSTVTKGASSPSPMGGGGDNSGMKSAAFRAA